MTIARGERVAKKLLPPPGVDFGFCEPKEDDTCQYRMQRKIGGKYVTCACGDKPYGSLGFWNPTLVGHEPQQVEDTGHNIPLCKRHIAEMAKKLVDYLW